MTEGDTLGMKLALYARVSSEEQREGQTIDSQLVELERFAREKGWEPVDVYKDDGWSGALLSRPELDRLRDDARKGRFQAVLVNDVDRLARNVTHLGIIKRDLERHGVRVVFRKLPSESSPTQNLMVNILGSFAEFEREMIADRTRRGRRHKVEERQQYLGCIAAYGYRYTRKDRAAGRDGVLEIVPAEAAIVRRMFEWVDLEGLSARRVVDRLNQGQMPARNGSRQWAKSSVLRILRNEMYAGVWHYNKFEACEPTRTAGCARYRRHLNSSRKCRPRTEWLPVSLPEHLRLVPRDRWERVQQRLDRNIAFSPRNEKHFYLLKGLTQCNGCKARYVGEPCHGRFYYRCHARCGRCPMVKEEDLNQAVLTAVRELLRNPHIVLKHVARLNERNKREAELLNQQAKEAELESKRIAAEENRILEAYRMGVISPRQLGSELEQLRARRNALQPQNGGLSVPQPEFALAQGTVRDYCAEAASRFDGLRKADLREFLRTIIRNILFDGVTVRIQGEIPLPVFNREDGRTGGSDQVGDLVQRRTATTEINSRRRNTGGIATTEIGLHGRNPSLHMAKMKTTSEVPGGRDDLGCCGRPKASLQRTAVPCAFELNIPVVRIMTSTQSRDELERYVTTKPAMGIISTPL
jgi:site-specific DNA recombinase